MNILKRKSVFLFTTNLTLVAVFTAIFFGLTIAPANAAADGWHIKDDATGGECTLIGTWNIASKTCALSQDLNQGIIIDSDNIILDGNGHTMRGSYYRRGYGVYLSGRTGVTIKNLNIEYFSYGIYLYSSSGNTLTNNSANSNGSGIYLGSFSNSNTLTNNTANSNNYYGINLYYSSNNTLTNNTANSNNYYGINLYYSSNNTLTNNTANSNNYYGIPLQSSSGNTLTNNTANSNHEFGIVLQSSSNNNTLTSNTANSNYRYGIYLLYSSNNTLTSNSAQENYNYDVFIGASLDAHCSNVIASTTGSGNRPIKYFNSPVTLEDETLSELILCAMPMAQV